MAKLEPGPERVAPDNSHCALLILDIINNFDFPEGEQLYERALPMCDALAELKVRCRQAGIPAIYLNDHFGRWRSDFSSLVEHCRKDGFRGREVLRKLAPDEDDYFVFKPMHSGFYQTTLELLLHHLQSRCLIVTGLASNICVLFTANDAHMRRYQLWTPADCMAAASPQEQEFAESHFQNVLSADIRPGREIPLARLQAGQGTSSQELTVGRGG
jgi:nicotinamidase-related amidase